MTNEQRYLVIELAKQGKGARIVAKELGISKTTAQRYLRHLDIEPIDAYHIALDDTIVQKELSRNIQNMNILVGIAIGVREVLYI